MNHWNLQMWQQVFGDILIILTYPASFLMVICSTAETLGYLDQTGESGTYKIISLWFFSIVFIVISHLISAGIIR